MSIIKRERSLVLAADVADMHELEKVVRAIRDIPEVGGVKLGFQLGLQGLQEMVQVVRNYGAKDWSIIYDHQKAANDIPAMGDNFADIMARSGVDAAILFPFTGPVTQKQWITSLSDANVDIIVGGMMTHPGLLVSDGGYVSDDAPEQIYRLACQLGVKEFVVPGNKSEWITRIRTWLDDELGSNQYVLWAPGFVTQGGDISSSGKAAGNRFHAIVGSGIYKKGSPSAMQQAAKMLAQALR